MTEPDWEHLYKSLRAAVAAMRSSQRTYFATRQPRSLADAKELERRVDELLALRIPGQSSSL